MSTRSIHHRPCRLGTSAAPEVCRIHRTRRPHQRSTTADAGTGPRHLARSRPAELTSFAEDQRKQLLNWGVFVLVLLGVYVVAGPPPWAARRATSSSTGRPWSRPTRTVTSSSPTPRTTTTRSGTSSSTTPRSTASSTSSTASSSRPTEASSPRATTAPRLTAGSPLTKRSTGRPAYTCRTVASSSDGCANRRSSSGSSWACSRSSSSSVARMSRPARHPGGRRGRPFGVLLHTDGRDMKRLAISALVGTAVLALPLMTAQASSLRVDGGVLQAFSFDVDIDVPVQEHTIHVIARRFTSGAKPQEVGGSPTEATFTVAADQSYTLTWSGGMVVPCSDVGHTVPAPHLEGGIGETRQADADTTHEFCVQTGNGKIDLVVGVPTSALAGLAGGDNSQRGSPRHPRRPRSWSRPKSPLRRPPERRRRTDVGDDISSSTLAPESTSAADDPTGDAQPDPEPVEASEADSAAPSDEPQTPPDDPTIASDPSLRSTDTATAADPEPS